MIVGILGGGQLGRMLALAGIPLGLRMRFLDPDPDCPAADVGELQVGAYDDERALERFVRGVDVVTYEFENVPSKTARWLTEHAPVHPPEGALGTAQDRLAEKACFGELGIETARHQKVDSVEEFHAALGRIGMPSILKTRRLGYDGKGQWAIRSAADAERAWGEASAGLAGRRADLILEGFVPFTRELSMLGVRGRDGECRFYPPVQNTHERGILSRSVAPALGVSDEQRRAMEAATGRVLERLAYVGVLAVEYFDLGGGRFAANEMAPRVHNSGHWTIEGAECSQFENHIRAVCGMPLGSAACRGASVMLNVIGGEPDIRALLAMPGVHVHMYGKSARPGRKLGHVTVCAADAAAAHAIADRAAALLRNC
jgi:5-(carboxyamino)imidazole ribonucleotide synthase